MDNGKDDVKDRYSTSRGYFEYIKIIDDLRFVEDDLQEENASFDDYPIKHVKKRLILVYSGQNRILKSWFDKKKFKLLNRIWNSFFILDKDAYTANTSSDPSELENVRKGHYDEQLNKDGLKKQESHISINNQEEHPQEYIYIYGN